MFAVPNTDLITAVATGPSAAPGPQANSLKSRNRGGRASPKRLTFDYPAGSRSGHPRTTRGVSVEPGFCGFGRDLAREGAHRSSGPRARSPPPSAAGRAARDTTHVASQRALKVSSESGRAQVSDKVAGQRELERGAPDSRYSARTLQPSAAIDPLGKSPPALNKIRTNAAGLTTFARATPTIRTARR